MIDDDNRELILADCCESSRPVEMFSIENQKDRLVLASENLVQDTKAAIEQSVGWLPFFAEQYNISPKLKDYILVPVVIMPSDLPNRNTQAFPFKELIRADVETGQIGYETWGRMPTHKDHVNKDPTIAKGIILSSTMKPIPNSSGNLWKVLNLLAFDRQRDAILANDILTGKRPSYSMGSWAKYFTCSVCGSNHTGKVQGCEHISLARPKMTIHASGKLTYLQARHIKGFEVSSVEKPAFFSATTEKDRHVN